MNRGAGILMPISSLPSKYGIGCFSKSAYDFVDLLDKGGQSYWQILPLGPTGYGDSPYQSFSAFAGNPYFISLEELIESGLLTKDECEKADLGDGNSYINYEKLYNNRFKLLRLAYERADLTEYTDFSEFCKINAHWLDDYALFMALKEKF
ncbi:MAG: 4-alpha-glucanotransferase, partial [Clostridia bacterium]|nr:4-alpha-glucanotransferase [Clostridia bacterium]